MNQISSTPGNPANPNRRSHGWLLLLVFTLSGFSGLIYQSVWSHYLGLFLGHAAYAQALVLAIFMGGMALGAWLISRASHRWRNLVLAYAVAEAIIGIIALLFHSIFSGTIALSYDSIIPALGSPALIYLWKWLCAALLILPQSVLLGMTFPLLSSGYIRRSQHEDGQVLSGLYFTNSIGAALGALATTFWLLPAIGLPGTVATAGWLNLLVALAAWLISTQGQEIPKDPQSSDAAEANDIHQGELPASARFILIAAFITGASSFVYEIGWVRMLNLALGTTVHSFEIMLASFIAGLAFGGLWIRRRIDQLERPLRAAGFAQILMGLAVIVSLAFYNSIFEWVAALYASLTRTGEAYTLYNFGTAAIAVVIMMPAAFFAGMTLPLFTLALLRGGQGEAAIGRVYASNTLGAIAGVFIAVHILIPLLGLKLAMTLAATADLFLGLALLRIYFRWPYRFDYPMAIGASALAIFSALILVRFDYTQITSGVFRHGLSRLLDQDQLIYYKDGKTASISVVTSNRGTVRIATNGKTDGEARIRADVPYTQDEPTMMLAAALPLAYTEKPSRAAVIGFGTGLSTHTLLADPGLVEVDTIEIEQAIITGATAFGSRNQRAYQDHRSQIHIEDAKSYFSSQQQRYDIILSEPSNPWVSGVGALFSQEFYQFIPRFLNEQGVLVQWIQLYEISDELVASILNGLLPNFAHVEAFMSNNGDMIMLASNGSQLNQPARDIFAIPALREELALIDITQQAQLEYRRIADKAILQAFAASYQVRTNSDYFPVLSLNAPRTRFIRDTAQISTSLTQPEWPILEMLQVKSPFPLELPFKHANSLYGDHRGVLARGIHRYLAQHEAEALGSLPDALANKLLLVAQQAQSCEFTQSQIQQKRFIEQLEQLARDSIPFLPREAAMEVWDQRGWFHCPVQSIELNIALELFAATARRDATHMSRAGQAYLEFSKTRPDASAQVKEYAIISALLGLASQDDWKAFQALNSSQLAPSQMSKEGAFFRYLLTNYTELSKRAAG